MKSTVFLTRILFRNLQEFLMNSIVVWFAEKFKKWATDQGISSEKIKFCDHIQSHLIFPVGSLTIPSLIKVYVSKSCIELSL